MTQQGLPLNDDTDYGLCFACGPRNPWGLKLRFEAEGDRVTTTFTVSEEYQGFPGYLHGGVAGSILDETMSRVSLLEGRWTMTALMDVRFRFPVPAGSRITVEAVKTGEIRGFLKARGRYTCPEVGRPSSRRAPTPTSPTRPCTTWRRPIPAWRGSG